MFTTRIGDSRRENGFLCRAALRLSFAALFALPALGCGFVPKTQFSTVETQARILNEQNKAQLAEIANLKAHNQKLEDQLLEREKELAGADRRTDADRKRLANFQAEREQVKEQVDELVRGAKLTGIAPTRDDDVERLLDKYPLLRFDSVSGAYKLDADVAFGADGRISPESEKLLGEFAKILAQTEARGLRVMVVGRATSAAAGASATADEHRQSTERALSVASHLRGLGLSPERIGVSGLGPSDLRAGAAAKPTDVGKSRRVEIFVMGKRTPVVGWDAGAGSRL
jgi:outer membrane protein OmpA-like peptidoglycan-associated protein